MTTKVLAINYNEQNILRTLCIALIMCVALYGILVCLTVFATVDRKNYEQKIQTLHSEVGQLESEYMIQAKTIDLSFARSLGFEEVPHVTFTTRNARVGVSLATHNEI